jgi:predicted DNA-binding protein with PD1-like motif
MAEEKLYSAAEAQGGRVIAARIHPNLDVLETIEQLCLDYNIKYGEISTTIGSLRKFSLNYVTRIERDPEKGYTTELSMEGPFSLIAGQGLVSPDETPGKMNIHYHAVISGENNKIYGGHILPGTLTLTTLDLFITEVKGLSMSRSRDAETGAVVTTIHQE